MQGKGAISLNNNRPHNLIMSPFNWGRTCENIRTLFQSGSCVEATFALVVFELASAMWTSWSRRFVIVVILWYINVQGLLLCKETWSDSTCYIKYHQDLGGFEVTLYLSGSPKSGANPWTCHLTPLSLPRNWAS
jgi:hypothetical protein